MQSKKTFLMSTPKCLGAQIWQIYPRSASTCTPKYWHLVAKFGRSTLDLPADVPPVLTSSGQIWQIYPRSASRCTPHYWHLVAKIGRSTLDLLADVPPVLISSGQEWQFQVSIVTAHISRSSGRSTPWQMYPQHLVAKFGRSTLDLLADGC